MTDQALSLVCSECGAQLRSVKEAQDHGEATGHSSFEESTEAVKRLVCVDCGKPCRTETEREIHTQRTGHANFQDQTAAQAKPLDTEKEMQEESAVATAAAAEEEELVEPVVDSTALQELEAMGFGRNRALRALHNSGNTGVESAVGWLAEHEADADLDAPVLVPKATTKPKLTPEEAKAKAEELVRKAREKREVEEKESERLRELERIRAGKELLAAARQEDDLKFKRAAEARRLEREEEHRAREKVRQKLEEDRRERRRRLGLPPDLTPEELEAERKKAEQRAAEEAAKKLPAPVVVQETDQFRDSLVGIKKAHSDNAAAVTLCFQTLFKLVSNVATAPENPKFRRVNTTNAALSARLLPGSIDFLKLTGWQETDEPGILELKPGNPAESARLQAAGSQLDSALNNPFFGAL